MIGNPKLFGRTVSLEILPATGAAKEFSYPPFNFEFEAELDGLNITQVTMYNVNEETLSLVSAQIKEKNPISFCVVKCRLQRRKWARCFRRNYSS